MNAKTKTIIWIVLPVFILLVLVGMYYIKQPGGIKNKKSDYKISSRALNKEFILNDSLANAKYDRKVIEITGNVATIKNSEMHGIIITMDDAMMGIKCVMDSTVKTLPVEVTEGSSVSIKGVCVGSDNMIGVMMNQCFITSKK